MQRQSVFRNIIHGIQKRASLLADDPKRKAGLDWFTIKKLKHLTPGEIRQFNYHGKPIQFINPPEFLAAFTEIFVEEIYKANLTANPYILDCGANIGLSTLYFKDRHPDAEIVAFEPDEKNFALLETNIRSWKAEKITLRKEAVWKEDTVLNFSGDANMGSRIEENGKAGNVEVKAIRLEALLNRKVDFLKIDIEGAEYDVMKDISNALGNVGNMFLEYHGRFDQNHELNDIFLILTGAGFSYYVKEAASIYDTPFHREKPAGPYDVQLNIFCFRT